MIAVLGAMDGEIGAFLSAMDGRRDEERGGRLFHHGRLAGRDVVAARCGVGKVMAAMFTQYLIDQYAPRALVFTGLAGALNPVLDIGDTVVARDCLQHDLDATALGFARGEIPYSPYRIIESDPGMLAAARSYRPAHGKLVEGRILTGDQFITARSMATCRYLSDELAGDAVEMEGAAVGLTAAVNGLPFLLVRTVSDKADGSATTDFAAFLPHAARNSLACVLHILSSI